MCDGNIIFYVTLKKETMLNNECNSRPFPSPKQISVGVKGKKSDENHMIT